MGMPGSERALEELMCRVLCDLVEEGVVANIADDLYCGGNTQLELLQNWTRGLQALQKSGLNLSATKTIIAPKSTNILGWIWQLTIQTNPHRFSTLSVCPSPVKVCGLRSFSGTYKVLARVIPDYASLLGKLDDVSGRESKESIQWSDELSDIFSQAQKALPTNCSIFLTQQNDQIWIVTDGSVKIHGLGATLYKTRDYKIHVSGFFSGKL
ncbi:unnamed protein product [Mytilus coruscus]|uniref:Reverse transcriptase domain-containing protein n=1 Tax=Mytilus coruscus TaxID=42192 RepID=A0A6J8EPC9_MYTCO|nr:unnamed protein product [Mytilus coruscus]